MSNADLIALTEDDGLSKKLTTATTNYIYSLDGYINSIIIDFEGENLPTIGENDITSDITYTFNRDIDTNVRQRVTLGLDASVNALNISFSFAGQNYVCHIYRGATIEGIADGPNTPVQPPLSKTWPATSGVEAYELTPKTGEVVYNVNWDIPPMIASTNVQIQDVGGGKYGVQINRLQDAPSGDYVIKYCGQELVNVKIV